MRKFLQNLNFAFSEQFLYIPDEVKSVILDVGLSSDAHQSEVLLRNNPSACVFGFEPLIEHIQNIEHERSNHGIRLNPSRINKNMFIVPCALSDQDGPIQKSFYVTKEDSGCSSLLIPETLSVSFQESVTVYALRQFLALLPWSKFGYVDYIKIDAQGSDLDIVRGAHPYTKQIFMITVELSIEQYRGVRNSTKSTILFFLKLGFLPIHLGKNYTKLSRFLQHLIRILCFGRMNQIEINSVDPTFVNLRLLLKKKRSLKIQID